MNLRTLVREPGELLRSRWAWVGTVLVHLALALVLGFTMLQGTPGTGLENASDGQTVQMPLPEDTISLQESEPLPAPLPEPEPAVLPEPLPEPTPPPMQMADDVPVIEAKPDTLALKPVKLDTLPVAAPDTLKPPIIPTPAVDSTTLALAKPADSAKKVEQAPVDKSRRKKYPYYGAKYASYRTIQKVRRMLPMANEANRLLGKLKHQLDSIDRRGERHRLVRDMEKDLLRQYLDTVKDMTTSEGVILVKLISRQTGISPYELIREYRGGVRAFFFQGIAMLYDVNLKENYDSTKNKDVEEAIGILAEEQRKQLEQKK